MEGFVLIGFKLGVKVVMFGDEGFFGFLGCVIFEFFVKYKGAGERAFYK